MGRLNLKEFDALVKRKEAANNRARYNAGLITAAVLNTAWAGDPNRTPANPLDFVPGLKPEVVTLDQLTAEQQRDHFMAVFGSVAPIVVKEKKKEQ